MLTRSRKSTRWCRGFAGTGGSRMRLAERLRRPTRRRMQAMRRRGRLFTRLPARGVMELSAQQPGKAGSILDGSFLALINEQTLRTTVIAGRPDIGEPDWRGHIPGRAMTDDEVTDVIAWLMSQRPANPGQPYPSVSATAETAGEKQASAGKQ